MCKYLEKPAPQIPILLYFLPTTNSKVAFPLVL